MAYTGRELIAARCARFFKDGDFVNLGIGVPTMCINYLPEGVDLWLETETGACGTGPTPPIDKWDVDAADAGSNPITLLPQGSWLPHDRSFGFIRGCPGSSGLIRASPAMPVRTHMTPRIQLTAEKILTTIRFLCRK